MPSSPESPLEATVHEVDLHAIDISQFPHEIEGHHLQYHPEVVKLREACKEWGIFRLVNHEIPPDLIQKAQKICHELMYLPVEIKNRCTTSIPMESYFRKPDVPSPHEAFSFLNMPNPDSIHEMSRKIWSEEDNSNFCEVIGAFSIFLTDLAPKITKLVLASLGLDVAKFFHSDFEKCKAWLRINGYSSHGKSIGEEALNSHADPGCVTILYSDDAEGLEVRSKEGKWLNVKPASDHSLVINIGDSLKTWTNGRYRSAEHRVVCKGWTRRISLLLFNSFPDDTEIWAPEEFVDEDNPRRYKPFIYSQLLNEIRYNKADRGKAKAIERLAGM